LKHGTCSTVTSCSRIPIQGTRIFVWAGSLCSGSCLVGRSHRHQRSVRCQLTKNPPSKSKRSSSSCSTGALASTVSTGGRGWNTVTSSPRKTTDTPFFTALLRLRAHRRRSARLHHRALPLRALRHRSVRLHHRALLRRALRHRRRQAGATRTLRGACARRW